MAGAEAKHARRPTTIQTSATAGRVEDDPAGWRVVMIPDQRGGQDAEGEGRCGPATSWEVLVNPRLNLTGHEEMYVCGLMNGAAARTLPTWCCPRS